MLQAIDTALARASQVEPAFAPEKKKKNKGNILDESYELQRSAFMAARAALKGSVTHSCTMVATAVMSHPQPAIQIALNEARFDQAYLKRIIALNASQELPKQRLDKDAYLCYADCQDHLTLMVVHMWYLVM